MSAIVPTISSGTAGPLGVLHLPRLWQKVLLSAKGKLPEGYDECGYGYDQMVLDALGLDKAATVAFLKTIPTYPEFERWVLRQKGGSIDRAAADKVNAAIRGYNHKDEVRTSILSAAGISDDGSIRDAVNLNNIDDWGEFQKSLKAS